MPLSKLAGYISYAGKAAAAGAAFLGVLGASLSDGSVTTSEAGAIFAAGAAVLAVFKITNGAKP